MSTITCTVAEFNKAVLDFRKVTCSTKSTQTDVALAHKCLVLHYLGCEFPTDEDLDRSAMFLESTITEAMRRGWTLVEAELHDDEI